MERRHQARPEPKDVERQRQEGGGRRSARVQLLLLIQASSFGRTTKEICSILPGNFESFVLDYVGAIFRKCIGTENMRLCS